MDVLKVVENIQRICKEKGTNPTTAGKESGAGKDLVTNMKKKGTRPSIERIRLLADYLGVSPNDLLGEETEKPTVKDDGFTEEERLLVLAYRAASEDDRAVVDAALRKYKQNTSEKKAM
ncbi:MAG: helix-turn-helix transcriptional regulator [Lawsonibacter sp.]|nr:helix-turn-helix transcriptional regulator [Lawsonibacter sp.]